MIKSHLVIVECDSNVYQVFVFRIPLPLELSNLSKLRMQR